MNNRYLRTEIIRAARNYRALVFSVLMPAVMMLIFGGINQGRALNGVDSAAYVMVNMGLFGAMSAVVGSGGSIALERGLGWNRQLRLTPMRPAWYVANKVVLGLLMGVPPLIITHVIAAIALDVRLSPWVWIQVLAGSWLSALPFAALGVLLGYVARPDSVQQVSGLLYMLLAVFGGLWLPVEVMPRVMRVIADYTPAYWAGQVARSPMFDGRIDPQAVAVLAVWTLILALMAFQLFRRDAART